MSNLPPGVTHGMIPGNRPEDEWFEKMDGVVERELVRRGLKYGVDYSYDDVREMADTLDAWTNRGRNGNPYEMVEFVVDDWLESLLDEWLESD